MDTSETYIRMCIKAKEIQKLWNPEPYDINKENKCIGDVFFEQCVDNWGEEPNYYNVIEIYFAQERDRTKMFWLPRQDQLQEMVENVNILVKLGTFTAWVGCEVAGRQRFTSMEQLWLAFVMKEKYSKVWDGEEWHSEQI